MEKTRKIITILASAFAFYFVLASLAYAGKMGVIPSTPIWQITQDGTARSVKWKDHAPNPRFAIYDPNGDSDPADPATLSDDLVLDKETGLVWARDAHLGGVAGDWQFAIDYCRDLTLGNRKGWRLPTVVELLSLVEPALSHPALPDGHPFINVSYVTPFWTSTTYEYTSAEGVWVMFNEPEVGHRDKVIGLPYYVWPVRGGNGYATGSW